MPAYIAFSSPSLLDSWLFIFARFISFTGFRPPFTLLLPFTFVFHAAYAAATDALLRHAILLRLRCLWLSLRQISSILLYAIILVSADAMPPRQMRQSLRHFYA